MRGVFLGCTQFSKQILESILKIPNFELQAIFSIPKYFNISYSDEPVQNTNFADLSPYAQQLGVPHYWVDSKKGQRLKDYKEVIKQLAPDVILVMGWYYMVGKQIRKLAKHGAWGIHASLLPKYAGGAPLVWAIIEGETETGITLFKLDEGVDDGDIIAQRTFAIAYQDTIKEVYAKATKASKAILITVLSQPIEQITFIPQNKSKIKVWPQRSPKDGEIDWSWDVEQIRNFIRAQTRPYPGAYSYLENEKINIWRAHPFNDFSEDPQNKNGEVVMVLENGHYVVKCGSGFLLITEATPKNNIKIGKIFT